MASEIRVPTLGESIVEATVSKWLKQVGDTVSQGEPLVELETDKINVEVMAEQAGVIQRIDKPEGSDVAIDDVLGMVGEGAPSTTTASTQSTEAPTTEAKVTDNGHDNAPAATPVARRMAADHNIDVQDIQGSGPGGRVTKEDVVAQMQQATNIPTTPPTPAASPNTTPLPMLVTATDRREERIRMSRRRQTIARRLVEAQQTAAMLTTFNEIDMSAVMELRKRRRDAFKERHGIGLGFMSFFTKAVVGALKAFPIVNSEIQGDEVVTKYYYDIGIAVSTDEGLVVPVLRDADGKNFAAVEQDIAELAKRARENILGLAELQGGTFTITNGGVFGSLMSTPILNAPQVGILGMHKIEERPIVVNGEIVVRPMMYVALSYDHRIIDGSESVRFLVRIKELVEDPESLLLEG
ncbi:MAG: 2-oxoglutarate dehydrogenase complex dihydrolipoyllysine-residue succinyltransferase [Chloroflexota bacterium]